MSQVQNSCREFLEITTTSGYPAIKFTDNEELLRSDDHIITFVVTPENKASTSTPGFISPNELASRFENKWGKEQLAEARKKFAHEIYSNPKTLPSIRMQAGLSQRDLSEMTGLTQAHIARIESGQTEPGRPVMNKLCVALKIDMNTLNEALS
jgi:DNA-binding XRE family transcriptional regulator